jgi:hypothetical protein
VAVLKRKVEADDDGAAAFEGVRARFKVLEAERTEKQTVLDALSALQVWNRASDAEREDYRFAWARDRVHAAWPSGHTPKVHRIPALVQSARDDLDDFLPRFYAVAEEFEIAKRRRSGFLARALGDRQRKAVIAIHNALAALSEAMMMEAAVHAELQRTAPEPTSPFLPNCRAELTVGTYDDPQSAASQWRRRMRKIGTLA